MRRLEPCEHDSVLCLQSINGSVSHTECDQTHLRDCAEFNISWTLRWLEYTWSEVVERCFSADYIRRNANYSCNGYMQIFGVPVVGTFGVPPTPEAFSWRKPWKM